VDYCIVTSKKEVVMAIVEKALLGGGCFWCIEAVYQQVRGVEKVRSGYAGGRRPNPTYESVCTGASGHAEVVEIIFDPGQVSYEAILDIFWSIHNPTTLNAQGADRGSQYRSVIYYYDEIQKTIALSSKEAEQKNWENPIVTEFLSAPEFFEAEAYHQNYYNEHSTQGYCQMVIQPKIAKFMKKFEDKIKK
jgi:peptide-methionine (S)-S-oxide reductase